MKRLLTALLTLLPLTLAAFDTAHTLWYDRPALQWEETLPLGNGRLGMMPDGGINHEKLVLNEISMWSGHPADYSNAEAAKVLPQIQGLLAQGRNREAQELMFSSFMPDYSCQDGKGGYCTYGAYQVLADLDIDYAYPRASVGRQRSGDLDYRRWLDLSQAVAYTTFQVDSVTYVREYYVPRGADAIVMHVYANRPGQVSLSATLSRCELDGTITDDGASVVMRGMLPSGIPGVDGVKYWARVHPVAVGGTTAVDGAAVTITGADEAWLVVEAGTDYWQWMGLDPVPQMEAAPTPEQLRRWLADNTAMHRTMYGRAGISLPPSDISALPTDVRIARFRDSDDPQLASLYYNYGRYLLISSTRPGLLPPNLQGLWANGCGTPWNGDYHTNINVQMNHWPAEQGNLSELHLPLVQLVKRAIPEGEKAARDFYGDTARGWVMHMMTNPWGYCAPGEHPSWGATNTGGAWLCQHLWEHHLYNPADTAYLREIYPIMKGAADFFISTMVQEPDHGWLVTSPSSSPENEFYDGTTPVSICMGPTMDTQIVGELLRNTLAASQALGIDSDYGVTLQACLDKLPPMQIGSDGRLMEWLREYPEVDPHHRHVSHLYGLHPGNQISVVSTPELADACRRTLDVRGDEGTGWSRAWKVNFWARLGDGDRAYKLLKALLYPAYTEQGEHHGPGTFPNLYCSHPPFQIDGNFGGASGISEMLVQSQDGFVNLLPALPAAWPDGSLHGIKVRGGATVDLTWHDGAIVSARIHADDPGALPLSVRIPDYLTVDGDTSGMILTDGYVILLTAPELTLRQLTPRSPL